MTRPLGKQILAVCEYIERNPGTTSVQIRDAMGMTERGAMTQIPKILRRAEYHGLVTLTDTVPMCATVTDGWRANAYRVGRKPVLQRIGVKPVQIVVTVRKPVSVFDFYA